MARAYSDARGWIDYEPLNFTGPTATVSLLDDGPEAAAIYRRQIRPLIQVGGRDHNAYTTKPELGQATATRGRRLCVCGRLAERRAWRCSQCRKADRAIVGAR